MGLFTFYMKPGLNLATTVHNYGNSSRIQVRARAIT